nr:hypothetical protein [uncultured Rhodopila sp.]
MTKAPMPMTVELLTEAALSNRSALYVWMLENHDTFAAVVAKAGRPNWQALSEAFGTQGYTDSDGQPPSDEVTRQTWWRVRKTVKARRAKQPPPPVAAPAAASLPATPSPPAPPVARVLPEPGEDDDSRIIEPRRRFNWQPAVPRAKPPKQGD